MSTITDTIQNAQRRAAEIRPQVGGFPVLSEVLRQAGIPRNEWTLPAGRPVYVTDAGAVVEPATPSISAISEVPAFDRDAQFKQIKRRLTTMWGLMFAVMVPAYVIAGALDTRRANLLFSWAIPTGLVVWAAKWTARVSDSATNDQALSPVQ